ncbi:MAG TPA: orotidine-5'-phosphate decarboxylase [Edaphocola sp.]|nr:orotidine-5'-phosphate decarboxylase [Edaphocola sp.]
MNRKELIEQIHAKKSFLCVGLDSDLQKIPRHLFVEKDPVFAFNKAIINATKDYAVAYKINTAFYESQGLRGLMSMAKTLDCIPKDCFTIADAKRADIGNTSEQYARAFFDTLPFDSITVAPYMGSDSIKPFLQDDKRWAIVLGLTSNKGSQDFQMQKLEDGSYLYEKVLKTAASWGHPGNMMFVIGATREEQLKHIRDILPEHFFLIPGVGAQGGSISTVAQATLNKDKGILVNASRSIIFAGGDTDFDKEAGTIARKYQEEMAAFF